MAQFLPQIVERCYYLQVGIGHGNESRTAVSHSFCPHCDYFGDLTLLLYRFVCGCSCSKTGFPPNVNPNPITYPIHDDFSDNHSYLDAFSNSFPNPDQANPHTYSDGDPFPDANSDLHAAGFQHSYPDPDFHFYRYLPAPATLADLDSHSNRYTNDASDNDDCIAQPNALAYQRNTAFALS
jgi:hypothetical protein